MFLRQFLSLNSLRSNIPLCHGHLKQLARYLSVFSGFDSNDVNKYVSRTHTCGQLDESQVGVDVTLCGWIMFKRMDRFIILRDSYGLVQLNMNDKKHRKQVRNLMPESVIQVSGRVGMRPDKDVNHELKSGKIEVDVTDLSVLNECSHEIPFIIRDHQTVNEKTRLEHRYIDLRSEKMQRNLRLRSSLIMKMRQFLHEKCGFVEVETPTLFKRTPGGAQEFIVPSRFPNQFYSLVQSPQQFKQLLMMGGIDRYFQIARCYRDEGTKPDRQPEFTQLDLEMSFTSMDGIMNLIEELLEYCWPKDFNSIEIPFARMSYNEAINNYGTDKPDLRKSEANANCFVWIVDFPMFLPKEVFNEEEREKESNNLILESAHHPFTAPKDSLDGNNLIKAQNDRDKDASIDDTQLNSFVSIPSQHFDLVLNGQEIGGGSIRIHDAKLQEFVLKDILKEDVTSMEYFLSALRNGSPPHGGIALGLDRLLAIICNQSIPHDRQSASSIRDVIAFPKSAGGKDLMSGAPDFIEDNVKRLYHIKSIDESNTEISCHSKEDGN